MKMAQASIPNITDRIPDEDTLHTRDRSQYNAATGGMITISKTGWWSAVLTSACSAGYGITVIALLMASLSVQSSATSQGWTGIDDFLRVFQPSAMLPLFPSLLLAPAFTALMVSIHSYAPEDKKIWSLLGLSFTLIYATMAVMNYMIQLLPVWRSISHGETDGLAMFVSGNPHSVFWGLAYAYIFMNLGMLLTAPVFSGDRLKNRVRLLFILNGVSAVFTLASAFLDNYQVYLVGSLVFWCPVFTAAALSVAVLFNRTGRAGRAH
jgi:hypothetical protein